MDLTLACRQGACCSDEGMIEEGCPGGNERWMTVMHKKSGRCGAEDEYCCIEGAVCGTVQ